MFLASERPPRFEEDEPRRRLRPNWAHVQGVCPRVEGGCPGGRTVFCRGRVLGYFRRDATTGVAAAVALREIASTAVRATVPRALVRAALMLAAPPGVGLEWHQLYHEQGGTVFEEVPPGIGTPIRGGVKLGAGIERPTWLVHEPKRGRQ